MKKNLFAGIPSNLPEELFDELASGRDFSLKRIVSRGHTTDWYDQPLGEWVILLQGSATLEFEDQRFIELKPGDYLQIPPHCRHRVSRTDPTLDTLWLALYFSAS